MTDENPTWPEAFTNAVRFVERAYGVQYTEGEKAALRETLHRRIRQPLRLVKIAKLIPDSFKLFKDRLPTPEFWLRTHRETGYVAPHTFGHNCHKCDDSGWIQYQIERMGIVYTEVAVCECTAGLQHQSDYTKRLQRFEDYPHIAAAIQDGRIEFRNGRAFVAGTRDTLVQLKVKPEREPEPEPEPEEPDVEDIRDTLIEQEEIPF